MIGGEKEKVKKAGEKAKRREKTGRAPGLDACDLFHLSKHRMNRLISSAHSHVIVIPRVCKKVSIEHKLINNARFRY
jgi:hypothetical protein